MTYIGTVKALLEQAENDWPSLLARFERLRATLLCKKRFLVNLTGDKVGVLGISVSSWCSAGRDASLPDMRMKASSFSDGHLKMIRESPTPTSSYER